MKFLIILLNCILAGVIVGEISGYGSKTQDLTLKSDHSRKRSPAAKTSLHKTSDPAGQPDEKFTGEDPVQEILSGNIFNITRCTEAIGGRRGRGGRSMVLVGIFQAGGCRGAIIQQETGNSGRRRRNQASAQQTKSRPKQTVFLGETLDNGYTVSEIYDDRVVLTRGGGRMELRLELASRPVTRARAEADAKAARPTDKQIQQRMQWQQMRLMRQLMRSTSQMQQQMRNSGGRRSNTGSTRSRR